MVVLRNLKELSDLIVVKKYDRIYPSESIALGHKMGVGLKFGNMVCFWSDAAAKSMHRERVISVNPWCGMLCHFNF